MAVRIQFRRGTFAEWDAVKTSVILAAGELGYESTNKLIKFGDGVSTWDTLEVAAAGDIVSVIAGTGLQYGPSTTGYGNAASAGFSGVVELGLDTSVVLTAASIDAKGDLLVGTAPDTYTKVAVPASTSLDITNGKSLVADSTQSAGVAWKQVVPPGVIQQYAGTTAPAGYLMCDGGTVSYNTYGALATVLGTTYGPITGGGDLYRLPDLKGKVPVGKAASGTFVSLNGQGGAETVSLSESQMPPHTHGMSSHTHGMGNHRHSIAHGHGHNITTSDSGHQHPASSPIINNNDQPGYFYTRRGTAGINYDWSSANLVRWDAYQYPGTSSASANVSISGGVSNSADNSGTPIAQTTNNANNSTDGPSTANTANAGGTSGTVVAHNNLQPYIVLNYIIKT